MSGFRSLIRGTTNSIDIQDGTDTNRLRDRFIYFGGGCVKTTRKSQDSSMSHQRQASFLVLSKVATKDGRPGLALPQTGSCPTTSNMFQIRKKLQGNPRQERPRRYSTLHSSGDVPLKRLNCTRCVRRTLYCAMRSGRPLNEYPPPHSKRRRPNLSSPPVSSPRYHPL